MRGFAPTPRADVRSLQAWRTATLSSGRIDWQSWRLRIGAIRLESGKSKSQSCFVSAFGSFGVRQFRSSAVSEFRSSAVSDVVSFGVRQSRCSAASKLVFFVIAGTQLRRFRGCGEEDHRVCVAPMPCALERFILRMLNAGRTWFSAVTVVTNVVPGSCELPSANHPFANQYHRRSCRCAFIPD